MNYLAIRTEQGKGVYYFNSNGEKSRILSKFPGSSTRVFIEEMKKEACEWAGVEDIVSEETNKWATTKNNNIPYFETNNTTNNIENNHIEEINETNISNDKTIIKEVEEYILKATKKEKNENENLKNKKNDNKTKNKNKRDFNKLEDEDTHFEEISLENKETIEDTNKKSKEVYKQTTNNKQKEILDKKENGEIENEIESEKQNSIKHIPTNFEQILDIYKRLGSCMLSIEMISGENYCIIPEGYWYLSKDTRKFRTNEKNIPYELLTCNYLREIILEDAKTFKETKTGPKNPMFGEIVSTDMLAYIPKTKYLAFGNLIYISNANFYEFEELIDKETNRPCILAKRNNLKDKINITINSYDIKKISIIENKQKIETKEFFNLLKKVQKEKELEKNTKNYK